MQEIEDFNSSDLKPAEEIKERIDSPTEEQIHNERLNRELIQDESTEKNQASETKEEVIDDRERTSSGDSKLFVESIFTKNCNYVCFHRFAGSGSNQASSGTSGTGSSWEKVEEQ